MDIRRPSEGEAQPAAGAGGRGCRGGVWGAPAGNSHPLSCQGLLKGSGCG